MNHPIELIDKTSNFITLPRPFQTHAVTTTTLSKNTKCVKIELKGQIHHLPWDLSINETSESIQLPRRLAELNGIGPGVLAAASVVEEAPVMISEFTVVCDSYRDYEVG